MYVEEKVKAILFARWISICYADEHLDESLRDQHTEGFDPQTALSVLNRQDGHWWKQRLEHFEKVVLPNYIKNGSVEGMQSFLLVSKT